MLSSVIRDVVHRHVPLKQKTVPGINALFMTKKLNKAIMDRSRIKNLLELKNAKRLCKNQTK